MDYATIGTIVSVAFEQVPALKQFIAGWTVSKKRLFFAGIVGLAVFVSNWLAWRSIGTNQPIEWSFLWNTFIDWFMAYVGNQLGHAYINKKLASSPIEKV